MALNRLAPDFKTIANFRVDNCKAPHVCRVRAVSPVPVVVRQTTSPSGQQVHARLTLEVKRGRKKDLRRRSSTRLDDQWIATWLDALAQKEFFDDDESPGGGNTRHWRHWRHERNTLTEQIQELDSQASGGTARHDPFARVMKKVLVYISCKRRWTASTT